MSGHSKWATTKHHKAAVDAKKGNVFSKHSKLIIVAARMGGGDPATNNALALAIERAKGDSMPNVNIERAIKSGTGELKEGLEITESMYEGYGPSGVAIYLRVITDNKNRSVASVRHTLEASGGSLGTSGSVAYMFKKKGTIHVPLNGANKDELMMQIIDAGAEDVRDQGDSLEVITDFTQLMAVKKKLDELKIVNERAVVTFLPENTVHITDEEAARKVMHLMEKLDNDEDVDEVYSNFEMEDALMEKVMG